MIKESKQNNFCNYLKLIKNKYINFITIKFKNLLKIVLRLFTIKEGAVGTWDKTPSSNEKGQLQRELKHKFLRDMLYYLVLIFIVIPVCSRQLKIFLNIKQSYFDTDIKTLKSDNYPKIKEIEGNDGLIEILFSTINSCYNIAKLFIFKT